MEYFRIKTIEEIMETFGESENFSQTGKKFFFKNGNKKIKGNITVKNDELAGIIHKGIIFNKVEEQLDITGFSSREIEWMRTHFIITYIEQMNVDKEGNYLLCLGF